MIEVGSYARRKEPLEEIIKVVGPCFYTSASSDYICLRWNASTKDVKWKNGSNILVLR